MKLSKAPFDKIVVPNYYLVNIEDYADRLGLDLLSVFKSAGLEPSEISTEIEVVKLPIIHRALTALLRELNDESIGLEFGNLFSILSHGPLGTAIMASANIHDALRLVERYAIMRSGFIDVNLQINKDLSFLELHNPLPKDDVYFYSMDSLVNTIFQGVNKSSAGKFELAAVEFERPRPSDVEPFYKFLNCELRFNCLHARMYFDTSLLECEMPFRDSSAYKVHKETCEKDLAKQQRHYTFSSSIMDMIFDSQNNLRTCDELARLLNMSVRTLRRKLEKEGSSYNQLLQISRVEKSKELLRESENSIEFISGKLGYLESTSFSRAFKNWTGETPRDWRKKYQPITHLSSLEPST